MSKATNIQIGQFSSISKDVIIGDGSIIGDHVSIEDGVIIGRNCYVGSFTKIYKNSEIGDNVQIQDFCNIGTDGYGYAQDSKGLSHYTPQIGKVVLSTGVRIGSHVSIDRAAFLKTEIGRNTIVNSFSHIAHNVIIGEDCYIDSGFVVAGSAIIGNKCQFSAKASSVGHINITNEVQLKEMGLVNNSIKKANVYYGHPLQEEISHKESQSCIKELNEWEKTYGVESND
ncbi:MAG: hypothetical protein AB8E15_04000 [Bdellovibrionales bacterium]